MSTPYLRTKALVQTKELLWALSEPTTSWDIPLAVQEAAHRLLQHYPTLVELQRIHEAMPELLGPVPPFSRLAGNPTTVSVIEATRDASK